MNVPLVSVILPTYQRGGVIGRALRSVLTQSLADLELLVIDNGSSDHTEDVVRSFRDPRVRYVSYPDRRGASAARNRGMGLARGKYMAFQDSDDEWLPNKLALQVARLDSLGDEVALTQAAVLRYDAGVVEYLRSALPRGEERNAILRINMTSFFQGLVARTAVMQETGGFDERLPLWEDWELLIRICQRYRIDTDERAMAVVYGTPGGLTEQWEKRARTLEIIMEKHAGLMGHQPAVMAANHYSLARWELAYGDARKGRQFLLRSLGHDPTQLKTWAALLLALVGRRALRVMDHFGAQWRRWRKGRRSR